jgi:hypothetical protein
MDGKYEIIKKKVTTKSIMQVLMSLIEIKNGNIREIELVESGSVIIFAFCMHFSCFLNFSLFLFSQLLVFISFKGIDSIIIPLKFIKY